MSSSQSSVDAQTLVALAGMRVLLMDDSFSEREMLTDVLERGGAHVIPAARSADALEVVRCQRPDVLVSDLSMPGHRNYAFIRRLRELPPEHGGLTPAVALAGIGAGPEDLAAALAAGYQAHFARPFQINRFFGALTKVAVQVDAARHLRLRARETVAVQRELKTRLQSRRREILLQRDRLVASAAGRDGAKLVADASTAYAPARPGNRILAGLPDTERRRLEHLLIPVYLSSGRTLANAGDAVRHVYFPGGCVASRLCLAESGKTIELTTTGREGMTCSQLALGMPVSLHWTRVLVAGDAVRASAPALLEALDECPALRRSLLRYAQAEIVEISQSAACNRLHHVDAQLCTWLLRVSDRLESDELPVTHDAIASSLGIRRAGVSVAAGDLCRLGLIRLNRGRFTIADRAGLESAACECYRSVREEIERLSTTLDAWSAGLIR